MLSLPLGADIRPMAGSSRQHAPRVDERAIIRLDHNDTPTLMLLRYANLLASWPTRLARGRPSPSRTRGQARNGGDGRPLLCRAHNATMAA